MGFIEQTSSRSPSTLRGVPGRPPPLPLSSLSIAVSARGVADRLPIFAESHVFASDSYVPATSKAALQNIELAQISQRLRETFYHQSARALTGSGRTRQPLRGRDGGVGRVHAPLSPDQAPARHDAGAADDRRNRRAQPTKTEIALCPRLRAQTP